jgi:hypothetical protein
MLLYGTHHPLQSIGSLLITALMPQAGTSSHPFIHPHANQTM